MSWLFGPSGMGPEGNEDQLHGHLFKVWRAPMGLDAEKKREPECRGLTVVIVFIECHTLEQLSTYEKDTTELESSMVGVFQP